MRQIAKEIRQSPKEGNNFLAEDLCVEVIPDAEAARLQDAVRLKYKKAFAELKDQ